ncbi:hypothetical protein [Hymenobacter sp. BT190]|uniref:hypothetical protein n=1 Tax=Hymenobacter sp. BT190 TaxID=2763505 RepID=UPI0016510536|nr:hypothetical protein [Hymenobacter sp. BT190]MBC6697321.1 hypothetical protein [Hymenobacter sp. BT190]
MVRFTLLPTLAGCLLACSAQAQSAAKVKPAPAKTEVVQPFAPAATPDDHELAPTQHVAPETKEAAPALAKPATAPSAPATPAKARPKPAKQ